MQISRPFIIAMAFATATPGMFQAACDKVTPSSVVSKLTAHKATAAMILIFAGLYIRLLTKSTAKQRVNRTWAEYFIKLASLLDVTQLFTNTNAYCELFDQIIVGDELKVIDKSIRKDEDDSVATYKDKHVKSYPSGMMGYLDSYIFKTLKKFTDLFDGVKKCAEFADYVS